MRCCFVGQVQNLDIAKKCVEGRLILLPPRRHFDTEQELPW